MAFVPPIFDAGLFFLILGFGFFFTFVTWKSEDVGKKIALKLVAMSLFLTLGVITASGYEIAFPSHQTITNQVTGETWKEDDYNPVISGGTSTYWIGFLFYGFAILDLVLISKDVTHMMKQEDLRR